MNKLSTIIVGAGWSGLACAIKLVQAGLAVTLIEATPNAGGRARSIKFGEYNVDNGQHLLIGAYTNTLTLLETIGLNTSSILMRTPMRLHIQTSSLQIAPINTVNSHYSPIINNTSENINIKLANIFTPLHMITGLMLAHGLTSKEKLSIVQLFITLHKHNFAFPQDCSILIALKQLNQSEHLITHLWEPIALAIMSTPITMASANIFFQVLKDVFTGNKNASNWLFTTKDLDQLLPIPAIEYLAAHNVNIICKQAITKIGCNDAQCLGVANKRHSWHAQNIVLATPAWVTAKLLSQCLPTVAQNLSHLNYNTITTIYFLFTRPVSLPYSIIGLLDGPIQWVFDRQVSAQPNILSAVITSNLNATDYSNDKLIKAAITQLQQHFPSLPELLDIKVIKEKRAAFLCTPAMQSLRPTNTTGISNLFIAGDYTQTGYPATIEGAVKSGIACANQILIK